MKTARSGPFYHCSFQFHQLNVLDSVEAGQFGTYPEKSRSLLLVLLHHRLPGYNLGKFILNTQVTSFRICFHFRKNSQPVAPFSIQHWWGVASQSHSQNFRNTLECCLNDLPPQPSPHLSPIHLGKPSKKLGSGSPNFFVFLLTIFCTENIQKCYETSYYHLKWRDVLYLTISWCYGSKKILWIHVKDLLMVCNKLKVLWIHIFLPRYATAWSDNMGLQT